jgi:CheY-like chemotaxis protein
MSGEPGNALGAAAPTAGLRVLVAEDRSLIAAQVAGALRRAGCTVVGPVATLPSALAIARGSEAVDAAVLDIDLRGEPAYPVAEALRARGVPFLFLTGFGALVIPDPWRDAPRLEKPFAPPALLAALQRAVADTTPAGNSPVPGASVGPSRLVRQAWESIRHSRDLITEGRIVAERGGSGGKR